MHDLPFLKKQIQLGAKKCNAVGKEASRSNTSVAELFFIDSMNSAPIGQQQRCWCPDFFKQAH